MSDSQETAVDVSSITGNADRGWVWFPTWHELRSHYLREIGFLACLSQFIGYVGIVFIVSVPCLTWLMLLHRRKRATIFWIAGFTGMPNVIAKGDQPLLDGVFWTPQVVGGAGFIVSGFLFMLETQKVWWKPAWGVLGWWIGFWNLVGAFGFTVSRETSLFFLSQDLRFLITDRLVC